MKLPRVFFAALLILFSIAPVVTAVDASEEDVQLASDTGPDRNVDPSRASRSGSFSVTPVEAVVDIAATPPETTTTTTAPTTTTTAPPAKPAAAPVAPPVKDAKPKPAPKPAAETPTSTTGGKQDVVSIAKAQLGKAYRSGATGPNAFDCSGFVYWVFNQAGYNVPRLTSETYASQYIKISRAELQPGDLVGRPGHIGIYIGNGQMIHASTPRGGVKQSPIDSAGTVTRFIRIG